MSPRFTVVIPVRLASTRLPGKALLPIAGRPMIQHVWERASESGAGKVVLATDDQRVVEAAGAFGATALMTDPGHRSGTERVAEAARLLGLGNDEVVVNVQGDEPLVPPALIDQVAGDLTLHPRAQMATLCEPIDRSAEVFDPGTVKVVTDREGYALYFSRAPIPWHRGHFEAGALPGGATAKRHIGIYACRVRYLRTYASQGSPEIEKAESLEQLRALYHGARVRVVEACERPGPGVDTARDLERVRALVASAGASPPSSSRRPPRAGGMGARNPPSMRGRVAGAASGRRCEGLDGRRHD